MKTTNVTSQNRAAARRLLNAWHDSRTLRVLTLAQLSEYLQRAINEGLISVEGVTRALSNTTEAPPKKDTGSPDGAGVQSRDDNGEGGDDADKGKQEKTSDEQGDEAQDGDGKAEGKSDPYKQGEKDYAQGYPADLSSYDVEAEQSDYNQGYADAQARDAAEEQDKPSDEAEEQDKPSDEAEEQDGQGDEAPSDEAQPEEPESNEPVQHSMFATVLKYVGAGLNVALVGPAGTGKSYIARQVAAHLELDFYVNGAMMSKYDLIGYNDANGVYHSTPAHDAFVLGGLHCFDEFDASAPDAAVSFNGMTDDQPFFTFPDGQQMQHENYVAIACMNTFGNGASADYVGRYKQDAAAMSRFVKVYIDYDPAIEGRCGSPDIVSRVQAVRKACDTLGIRHIVSTRMIVQAQAARTGSKAGRATRHEIDRDIIFSGLTEEQIKQVKAEVLREQKAVQS